MYEAMHRTGQSLARQDAFATCGSNLWLQINSDRSDVKLSANCCHDRFCIACQTENRCRIQSIIEQHLDGRSCRFITFTLRHNQTPLTTQIDRLYRCFLTLRRRKDLRPTFAGGAAFLEVKVGRDGLWHPHLHVLTEGGFIHHRDLSAAWLQVTGDSSIVDIRRVKEGDSAVAYVTKYLCKPASMDVMNDPARLDEFMIAVKGRRLVNTFGSWRGLDLHPARPDAGTWASIAPVEAIWCRSHDGDPDAIRWQHVVRERWPLLAELLDRTRPPPPPVDDPF